MLTWHYNGSCKLIALELHNNCSCTIITKVHEYMYMVPHTMNCVHYNSCNLFNNTHAAKIWWVAMKLQVVIVTQEPTCKASCKSHYIFIVLSLTYVVISF
jgi:hypothetical protein